MTQPDLPLLDLIISATEINDHHGVGILLQRFFPDSTGIVTLRSLTVYGGEETFGRGHHELKSASLTLAETEADLRTILAGYRIGRILCVPYYREDFIHGILAQKLTQAPLCTYIMDDQNVFSDHVPDHWVARLLRVSRLRFGISPELCAAYQCKYQQPFHLLPPVVAQTAPQVPCYWPPTEPGPGKVAMIGNVWTAARFLQLRAILRATGLQVDWYGNGSAASWLPGTPEEWADDNIHCFGFLPEPDLVASLAAYPCVLVPSGSLDADDDNLSFSRLSLPSRLIFLHTHTDTPVLLLGNQETAAGRFLTNLGTGLCAAYEPQDLLHQLAQIRHPDVHRSIRRAIRQWAPSFILPNGGAWLWTSLERQAPAPAQFHAAFQNYPGQKQWLEKISPARPPVARRLPAAADTLDDDSMRAFAFLRLAHLDLLKTTGDLPAVSADLELTQLLSLLTAYLLKRLLPTGGAILVLSTDIPTWTAQLPPTVTCWRLSEPAEWQRQGCPLDPGMIVDLSGKKYFPEPIIRFDGIVSSTWLDQVRTPDALARIADFFSNGIRPGGINLHSFTAVLHPDYFWTAPAHAHLQQHWQIHEWPGRDELLTTEDLYSMGEAAYEKYWQPSTGKTAREFGKALGLFLFWRKPA